MDMVSDTFLDLSKWLIREEITVYRSVSTAFRQFVRALSDDAEYPNIRVVCVTGEPVPIGDVALFKSQFSERCVFVNSLGCAKVHRIRMYIVDHQTPISGHMLPAGYEVPGVEVSLLDQYGTKVEIGEVGEIALKGSYLALGYWRQPDLTRTKFLSDPEGSDKRIYVTGDLGRLDQDGCLTVLGRQDFQVKIRGHRIEVIEVESALLDLDNVRDVAVVAQETPTGDQELCAYLVPERWPSPTVTHMREALSRKIPTHMVPTAFMALDTLPLTPTGKLDRRSLPELDRNRPLLDNPFVPPRTSLEVDLATIWGQVLEIDKVGISDDFFDLGGDSLLAAAILKSSWMLV